MINPTRTGFALVLSGLAALVALGPATGAAGSKAREPVERYWSGTTSDTAFTNATFLTYPRARGKKITGKLPATVDGFGMNVSLSCDNDLAASYGSHSYQAIPSGVGQFDEVHEPGGVLGGARLRVRRPKHRFSRQEAFTRLIYGATKRVEYTLRGRFRTPRRATGTVNVTTVWNLPDGTRTNCRTGQLPWSACAWKNDRRPACGGREPVEVVDDTE